MTSLITTGCGRVTLSERTVRVACSTISAFSFSTSTTARRTVQTLSGSYEAFRTRTRPLSARRGPPARARRAGPSGWLASPSRTEVWPALSPDSAPRPPAGAAGATALTVAASTALAESVTGAGWPLTYRPDYEAAG